MEKKDAIIGCLFGTAVGDAFGLACEGLSKRRQQKLFPDLEGFHFLFGKGMISDDTEHTCMVAQSLIVSGGKPDIFVKNFSLRLRWWLLGLPAGVGFATLRAILKLWVGVPTDRSGVFSAGNGPAMRSAIIGVCYGEQPERLRELVRASTRLTHTDPKAELGALAVALAAYLACMQPAKNMIAASEYVRLLQANVQETPFISPKDMHEFFELIHRVVHSIETGQTTENFAQQSGFKRGVSGYIYQTLPVVLHAWLRHPHDFRRAVQEVIRCGGDTDTTAAIAGAIIGAGVGKQGIPAEWIANLWEWPRSATWMERLGQRLYDGIVQDAKQSAVPLSLGGIILRNAFFLTVVLCHGFRRLLPPY